MKSNAIKALKNLFLFLFVISVAASCKKKEEDKCVPPALSSQIVGAWQANVSSLATVPLTFSDGGEVQGNLALYLSFFPGMNGVDPVVNYEVKSDTEVHLLATASGAPITPVSFAVSERDCEKIVLTGGGFTITLTK